MSAPSNPIEMQIILPQSKRGKKQSRRSTHPRPMKNGLNWYQRSSIIEIEHKNVRFDVEEARQPRKKRQTYLDSSQVFPIQRIKLNKNSYGLSQNTHPSPTKISRRWSFPSNLDSILFLGGQGKFSLLRNYRRVFVAAGFFFLGSFAIFNLAAQGLALTNSSSRHTFYVEGTPTERDSLSSSKEGVRLENYIKIDKDQQRQKILTRKQNRGNAIEKKMIQNQRWNNLQNNNNVVRNKNRARNIHGLNSQQNGGGYITENGNVFQSQAIPDVEIEIQELPEKKKKPEIVEIIEVAEIPQVEEIVEVVEPSREFEVPHQIEQVIGTPRDGAMSTPEEPNGEVYEGDWQSGFYDSFMDLLDGIFDQAPIEDISTLGDQIGEQVAASSNDDFLTETVKSPHHKGLELKGPPTIETDGSISLVELDNFRDITEPLRESDLPIFLHIPKAGGSTVKDIIGTCHRFVMASEKGILDGHGDDADISIVYPGGGPIGQDRSPFVNVDTTTLRGIARAKEMGFTDSGFADAVITPFIYEVNDLMTPTSKGRLFTVFRHPIERAISMFYYIQIADWEPTYDPEVQFWTIEQYTQSSKVENNWLTRQLSKQPDGELTAANLKIAKDVIRRKFLVGLVSNIEATMERFEKFFRWKYHVNPLSQEKCRQQLIAGGANSNYRNSKPKPELGSKEWELLEAQNKYDLELHEYIEALFNEQENLVINLPESFRNIDATCCKCGPPTYPPEGFDCPVSISN